MFSDGVKYFKILPNFICNCEVSTVLLLAYILPEHNSYVP